MKTKYGAKHLLILVMVVIALAVMSFSAFALENMSSVYVQMKDGTTLVSNETDFRFVAAIDSLDYDEVGFIISQYPSAGIDFGSVNFVASGMTGVEMAKIGGHTYLRVRITTVFESINAGNDVITADTLGGKYIASCKVKGIGNEFFGSTYRVVGYTKSGATLTYTAEKICSVKAILNGIVIDPSGTGGNLDFGQLEGTTAVSYANYVLAGTWTNNFRDGSNRLANKPNSIALIPLGSKIAVENAAEYTYNGIASVDHLAGAPVRVGFDANGNVVSVNQLGASVTYQESQLQSTYTTTTQLVDGVEKEVVTSATITLKSGASLPLDTNALAVNYEYNSFAPGGLIFFGTKSLALVENTDELITLYDTNSDGTYDFYSRKTVGNALEVVAVTDKTVTLKGQYGSADTTGWFEGKVAFNYKLEDGVEALKVGDRVNVMLTVDCTSNTYASSKFPARLKVLSKSTLVSGSLSDVNYGSYLVGGLTGEDVYKYMDVTVGGKNYIWSTAYNRNNEYADGSFGVYAGRTKMQAANYGTAFNFYLDTAGNIVFAELVNKNVDAVGSKQLMLGDVELTTQWDIQGSFLRSNNTYEILQRTVQVLYDSGYRRISVVYTNPGYPSFAATRNGATSRSTSEHYDEYYASLGFKRPIDAVVKMCHDLGMECYSVYKPYEGGGGATAPIGADIYGDPADKYYYGNVEGLGGIRGVYDDLLDEGFANGVDYRICRRPDGANNNNNLTIDKITIDYLRDNYYYFGLNADYETVFRQNSTGASVASGTYSNSNPHPTHHVVLFVSSDNGTYTMYTGSYNYSYVNTSAVMRDSNGQLFINADGSEKTGATNIIRLTISGLNLTSDVKFVAFAFNNAAGLVTVPYSSICAYSGSNIVTTSFSEYVRAPEETYIEADGSYQWSTEKVPVSTGNIGSVTVDSNGIPALTMASGGIEADFEIVKGFTKFGFEFNWYPYTTKPVSRALFAIARGVDEHAPGSPCEGYEEVRTYWLDTVKDMVEAGFDGVEIRLQSHSTMLDDYYNYGYNTPIVEKYKELYGESAYNTLMSASHTVTHQEFKRIMEIRGDFFMQFANEASTYCQTNGIEFSINLRDSYGKLSNVGSYADSDRRYMVDSMNNPTHWTMPKILIDWREAVDISTYVSFKDYIFYTDNTGLSNLNQHADTIKSYAKAQGKEVWIQVYDEQSGDLNNFNPDFLRYAANLGDVDCIGIYEIRSMYFWAKKTHEVYEALNVEIR